MPANQQPQPNPAGPPQPNAGGQPITSQNPTGTSGQNQGQPQANPNTTQNSLLMSEIRDNMVVMSDGSFRGIVACQSINFDLMSTQEREGIEFSYQNFLNSLTFPIQITVRSQRVDIGPYIDKLVNIRKSQDNMLLNVLMDDYINFIDILSDEANIMDKSFFIAIPYYQTGDLNSVIGNSKGAFGNIFGKKNGNVTKIDKVAYQKAKDEIKNRVDTVTGGLFQIGVKSTQLNTRQLGELYYNFYNPDTSVREPLGDFNNTTSTYVRKGTGESARQNLQEGEM
ncbi:MAG: hypothetical protein L0H38_00960 [bacterium]|nr:hypothetical protein [bacterium]